MNLNLKNAVFVRRNDIILFFHVSFTLKDYSGRNVVNLASLEVLQLAAAAFIWADQ